MDGRAQAQTHVGLSVDHTKVELILVLQGCLLLEPLDPVLLGVVIPRSLDVILVLLEQSKLGSIRELTSLFVVSAVDGVWKQAPKQKEVSSVSIDRVGCKAHF